MQDYEVLEFSFDEDVKLKLCLDKEMLAETIDSILSLDNIKDIRDSVGDLKNTMLERPTDNPWYLDPMIHTNGNCYKIDPDVFIGNLDQIIETYTLERTRYYLKRLKKSVVKVKTGKVNDINLNRWKEYKHIQTDSLWIENKRDRSGSHMASYWGNFIPQIPQQMMLRFTRPGDYVLDTFSGSGTTMIECRKLGRNGIGIELNHQCGERFPFHSGRSGESV